MTRVVIPVFPLVQALDVTGPSEVFSIATRLGVGDYQVEVAASGRSSITTSSGLELVPHRSLAAAPKVLDTLIVPGGQGTRQAIRAARADRLHPPRRPASPAGGVRLHRRFPARRGRTARRPASHHALELVCRARPTLPRRPGGGGPDLHPGGQRVDVGRRDRGHGSGARAAGGRCRQRRRARRGPAVGHVRPAPRWSGSVQHPAGGRDRRPRSRCARSSRGSPRTPLRPLTVEDLAERAHMSPRNFARVFKREVGSRRRRMSSGCVSSAPSNCSSRSPPRSSGSPWSAASAARTGCGGPSGGAWGSGQLLTGTASVRRWSGPPEMATRRRASRARSRTGRDPRRPPRPRPRSPLPGCRTRSALWCWATGRVAVWTLPTCIAAARAANATGYTAVLIEQPYRVAGRRSQPAASQLDSGVDRRDQAAPERRGSSPERLIAGGRSAGARVACRTASELEADGSPVPGLSTPPAREGR